jgi:hypothetical protein
MHRLDAVIWRETLNNASKKAVANATSPYASLWLFFGQSDATIAVGFF